MVPRGDAMCVDVEADNSTAGKDNLSSKQISEAIVALKAITKWPMEANTPPFKDEAATVYLNIVPTIAMKKFKRNYKRILFLPHPLSLDRSVCFISKNLKTKEQKAEVRQKLRELGVLGKITMIPNRLIDTAIANDDQDALDELCKLYDTYLRDTNIKMKELDTCLGKENKFTILVTAEDLIVGFQKTAILLNSEKNGYIVKVGHTGLTDKQLQENIASTADCINRFSRGIFEFGFASVKLMQLKTGTSEGVTVYQEDSIDEAGAWIVPAEVIADGIAALKAAADWPTEAKTPAFNDEAAYVYLNFVQKQMLNAFKPGHKGKMRLPHPLSLDRSVCYISQYFKTKAQQAEITQKFRELGVLGKIKIVPQSLVTEAVKNGNYAVLDELAKLYDTHLLEWIDVITIWRKTLDKEYKFPTTVHLSKPYCASLLFAHTALWVNMAKNGYLVKVGHTGLTDKQLQENIAAAIKSHVRRTSNCPNGFADIKSIQLMTGTSEGVTIHQDDSVHEQATQRPEANSGWSQRAATAYTKRSGGVKRYNTSPGAAPGPAKMRREHYPYVPPLGHRSHPWTIEANPPLDCIHIRKRL